MTHSCSSKYIGNISNYCKLMKLVAWCNKLCLEKMTKILINICYFSVNHLLSYCNY